jgi:glycosyltransferase involved in cell wall biosynthesis
MVRLLALMPTIKLKSIVKIDNMNQSSKEFFKKAGRKAVNIFVKPLKYNDTIRKGSSKAMVVALREIDPSKINPNLAEPTSDDIYRKWILANKPSLELLDLQKKDSKTFKLKPKFSILVPVYNVPLDLLKECVESVISQSYQNWELCLADDCSTDKDLKPYLQELAKSDKRIKVKFRTRNGHISRATNSALELATGEFIALLDNDDILWPNALYEFAKRINQQPTTDFLYSDEDKVDETGKIHFYPFFKPDWNPDFLRSINYITHFTAIKKEIVNRIGGERVGFEGSQDWDLFLRATKEAKNIQHISKVLYSWRVIASSTAGSPGAKPYIIDAQRKTLQADLKTYSNGLGRLCQSSADPYCWSVAFEVKGNPRVSIIVPSKNQLATLKRCLESIYKKTSYKNFEIIVVDTGSTEAGVKEYYTKLVKEKENFKQVELIAPSFSYSKACNFGIKHSEGEYILLLNNDTEVLEGGWLQKMLGDAMREEVGMVGVKLYYPGYPSSPVPQHAGVATGVGTDPETRTALNMLARIPEAEITGVPRAYLLSKRNVSAVTAACAMVSRSKFDQVGGLDEKDFKVTYNDVDLSLKLLEEGYINVYNPSVELIHHESLSLGEPENKLRDSKEIDLATQSFRKKWAKYIEHDPAYNSNFSKSRTSFQVDEI